MLQWYNYSRFTQSQIFFFDHSFFKQRGKWTGSVFLGRGPRYMINEKKWMSFWDIIRTFFCGINYSVCTLYKTFQKWPFIFASAIFVIFAFHSKHKSYDMLFKKKYKIKLFWCLLMLIINNSQTIFALCYYICMYSFFFYLQSTNTIQ